LKGGKARGGGEVKSGPGSCASGFLPQAGFQQLGKTSQIKVLKGGKDPGLPQGLGNAPAWLDGPRVIAENKSPKMSLHLPNERMGLMLPPC